MQTILGANGIIATELAKEIHKNFSKDIKLVSRNPKRVNPEDILYKADLLNPEETENAVKGSETVYLTVGLPIKSGKNEWQAIMRNVIDACISQKAKLVYFDNTYMYGPVKGLIKEDNPFRATGIKGKIRGETTIMLLDEIKHKLLNALIARAPEFYGPGNTHGITNSLIFENIKKKEKLKVLLKDNTLRTLIYTPDAARATALLGNTPDAFNQTWHLPCDNHRLTSREFIQLIGEVSGENYEYTILNKLMIRIISLFNSSMKLIAELLYRYETDNLFDSTKFSSRFPDFAVTTYKEGIRKIMGEIKGESITN